MQTLAMALAVAALVALALDSEPLTPSGPFFSTAALPGCAVAAVEAVGLGTKDGRGGDGERGNQGGTCPTFTGCTATGCRPSRQG